MMTSQKKINWKKWSFFVSLGILGISALTFYINYLKNDVTDELTPNGISHEKEVKALIENAQNLSRKDLHEKAILEFNKVIELEPKNPIAHRGLGNSYLQIKNYSKALNHIDMAIEQDNSVIKNYKLKGRAHYGLGVYPLAISAFTKFISLDSTDFNGYTGRANSYFLNKDYDEAIEDFSKAIKLEPQRAETYYDLGKVYFSKKDYKNAVKAFTKSDEITPKRKRTTDYLKKAKLRLSEQKNN